MFNAKSKSTDNLSSEANSIIGAGTLIEGDIETSGDIRIDGTLRGNLTARAKILIGPEGTVQGDINGQQADILGTVTGSIRIADLLNLKGKAVVTGDITAGKLQIEPTVTFNGQCRMGASVVELNNEKVHAINQ
jgi:cytoskeletal protein CcmA (bactofilin family)